MRLELAGEGADSSCSRGVSPAFIAAIMEAITEGFTTANSSVPVRGRAVFHKIPCIMMRPSVVLENTRRIRWQWRGNLFCILEWNTVACLFLISFERERLKIDASVWPS